MGFWARLFGREVDTTVSDYQARAASATASDSGVPARGSIGGTVRFTVQDVFVITGRGTVVTGNVEVGTVSVGDVLEWTHADGTTRSTTVTAIEAFRKNLDTAGVGELVGLLLRDVQRTDIPAGAVLGRP